MPVLGVRLVQANEADKVKQPRMAWGSMAQSDLRPAPEQSSLSGHWFAR